MYQVVHLFADLQDNNHIYDVGDKFPYKDMEVSEKRILELSTTNNRQGKILIKLVGEAEKAKPIKKSVAKK